MPINPQIVVPQVQGIQLENPMTFARNALAMRESQASAAANQLKLIRAEKAANVLAANRDKPVEEIANALLREGLADEAKGFVDYATSRSQAGEAARKQEVAGLALLGSEAGAFANDPTSLNKASIMPWAQNAVRRGLMSQDALDRFQAMPDDPQQLSVAMRRLQVQALTPVQQLETSVMEQGLGGESRVLRIPKLGGRAEEVPGSRERVTASPNRPVTEVKVLPSAKKFSETFGEKAATQFDNLYTKAQSAETNLGLSARLKPLLESEQFISGTLGNTRLVLAKALDLPGADDTQAYFSGIAGQVAENIKNFGAGTGLSDKDREFAEKMSGGSIELTPAAIKRIVSLNDRASKIVIDKYNTRRSQLSSKDKEIADYYPEIGTPKTVVRTGKLNGRTVVQYSDGTLEYGD